MAQETMKEDPSSRTESLGRNEEVQIEELDTMESGGNNDKVPIELSEEMMDRTEMMESTHTEFEMVDHTEMMDSTHTESEERGDEPTETNENAPDDKTTGETSNSDVVSRRIPKRVKDMYTQADWWSLWIGLISFAIALAFVFLSPKYESGDPRWKYIIPQPMKWTNNPLDAWDLYNLIGVPLLLFVLGSLYLLSLKFMGKITDEKPILKYAKGFAGMAILAVLSFWLGRQEWCAKNGLGYAIFAILFGMIIANTPFLINNLPSLKLASKDGEFFIKSSLVLLAVEFSVLGRVGWQAIVVAWVGSPLALLAGYWIGSRLFGMDAGLSLLVAVGSTWCGASAMSAVAAIIETSSADLSLSISVVAFFTVIFTFVQAYFALAVGMPHDVAGAWIGGSVDQTGNVIASAAIISEEATEIAGIVKIVLNSGLGILATIIAIWWQARRDPQDEENAAAAAATKKKVNLLFVWDKFPKFVLGYILCSAILTILLPLLNGTPQGASLQTAVLSLNKWWFAIAFVGIGIGTSVKELWESALKSGIVKLYLATNLLDILIALGLAYAVF